METGCLIGDKPLGPLALRHRISPILPNVKFYNYFNFLNCNILTNLFQLLLLLNDLIALTKDWILRS